MGPDVLGGDVVPPHEADGQVIVNTGVAPAHPAHGKLRIARHTGAGTLPLARLVVEPNGLRAWHRVERGSRIGPTAFALANRQCYPLLRQPTDHVAPSVAALLARLIPRRPCAFLVPLVDGVKRNVEQRRTSSVVKGRSDWAPAASPDSGTSSGAISVGGQFDLGQDHSVAIAPSSTDRSARPMPSRRLRTSPHLAPSAAFASAVREMDRLGTASPTGRTCHRAGGGGSRGLESNFRKPQRHQTPLPRERRSVSPFMATSGTDAGQEPGPGEQVVIGGSAGRRLRRLFPCPSRSGTWPSSSSYARAAGTWA